MEKKYISINFLSNANANGEDNNGNKDQINLKPSLGKKG